MVRVKWKLDRESGNVYLKLEVLGSIVCYCFPKRGYNKRFHPRSIFTRQIDHSSYKDLLIPKYVEAEGWEEGEIGNEVIKRKLKFPVLTWEEVFVLTWEEFFDQLGKAC
jgi:hypothetical protein